MKHAICMALVAWVTLACTRTQAPAHPVKAGSAPRLSIEAAAAGLDLKSPPAALAWSPDGAFLTYLEPGADGLNQLVGFDVKSKKLRVLVRPLDLVEKLVETEAEKAIRERRRQSASGIMQYFWFPDSRRILVPVGRELVAIDIAAPGAVRLLSGDQARLPASAPLLDVKLSPDGSLISFSCAGDLHVLHVASRALSRITQEGSATRFFGLAEFVAQEEMDRNDGAWWSPDSATLAFTEVDEGGVMIRERPDLGEKSASIVAQRYPSAGTPNAVVKLHYYHSPTKSVRSWQLGAYEYLARLYWQDAKHALVAVENRAQSHLRLLSCEVGRDDCVPVLEEADQAWVELHSDLQSLPLRNAFFWSTENPRCYDPGAPERGRKTLFLFSGTAARRASSCLHQGKPMMLPVPDARMDLPEGMTLDQLVAVHPKLPRVILTVFSHDGRQRQLVEWDLNKRTVRPIAIPGATWVSARFSPDFSHFSARLGSRDAAEETALFAYDGTRVHTIVPGVTLPKMIPPAEVDVPSKPGSTTLNGQLWSPPDPVRGRRYPAIIYVYGGPHGQMVQRRLTRNHLWCRAMADAGFYVLMVDGRGGMYRDRRFAKAPHGAFGVFDVEDVRSAVGFLKSQPGVDPARIGLWGWSYGGYLAVAALFRDTGLAAAAAVAPPVDWSLYDTHYTERYLGLPSANPAAYGKSSVLGDPAGVKALPLLVVHGMSDDNVLLINSLQLFQKLQNESRMFEMMLYPGRAHSLWGNAVRTHLLLTLTRFFQRNL
ncbi:DPP IV N-terminal domain-containing protein [Myxococcota bacterium]|nr:DPP IV N-terminal domain-containing protein [Myxococcota bacterium]MBU1411385.1 DPP IV N-terminal domain-containing protein [Myxococcota bacterium]MBU1509518.1 DPP IV N-terminal domain-containing protein [Myxococcota bacterium]